MTHISPASFSDRELLTATARAADRERRTTVDLLALLAELDTRKLYLREGYSSLFTYCTQVLHLSESAAYSRITAARAARRFPVILQLLTEGTVSLTTVSLLAAHLTDDNYESLLDAARHKTRREVERLVALIDPRPEIPESVRAIVTRPRTSSQTLFTADVSLPRQSATPENSGRVNAEPVIGAPSVTSRPASSVDAPLSPERYLLKVTISRNAHETLQRAQALLRHTNPSGDLAAVVECALTLLVAQLEKTRFAAASRARDDSRTSRTSRTRHVPATVKRAVWTRDEGRCAFVGSHGRCTETAFVEFHHVRPFAAGGATDASNLQLRCRSHNAFEAVRYFGADLFATDPPGAATQPNMTAV